MKLNLFSSSGLSFLKASSSSFSRSKILIIGRWCFCQSLNRDSAILLQAQDLVPLIKLTKCRIYWEGSISFDPKYENQ